MMGIVSFTVDYVLTGKTQSAQLFIFTDKYDEVARELTNQVHRGVTLIDAKGWYTGQDKKIILIVARKHEASEVLRLSLIHISVYVIVGRIIKSGNLQTPPRQNFFQR